MNNKWIDIANYTNTNTIKQFYAPNCIINWNDPFEI